MTLVNHLLMEECCVDADVHFMFILRAGMAG